MSRLGVLPPERGASAYLNVRYRDERSGRECLQLWLNLRRTREPRWESGRRPRGGRAGGCAEAPLAGLPPYGPPSLTQSASEVAHRRNCCSSRQQLMHNRFRTVPFQVHRSGRSPSQSLSFPCGAIHFVHIDQQSSSTSRRADTPCSFMSIRVAQTCGRKMCDFADPRFRGRTSPALEWAFLGSGAAFHDQPARGSLRERATSSASPAR
jgi:hypothetical protein